MKYQIFIYYNLVFYSIPEILLCNLAIFSSVNFDVGETDNKDSIKNTKNFKIKIFIIMQQYQYNDKITKKANNISYFCNNKINKNNKKRNMKQI